MKCITKCIKLSATVSRQIDMHDPQQLEQLKNNLQEQSGIPTGWQMLGIPLLAGMMLSTVSFALSQPYLWLVICDWLVLPQHTVMAAIVPVSLIYCLFIVSAMFFVARGSYPALKLFLVIVLFSGLVAMMNFGAVCGLTLLGDGQKTGFILCAVLGLIATVGSLCCLNSTQFYRSCALYLHNRVWRKLLSMQQRT